MYRLLALGMELPEDAFLNIHSLEESVESYGILFAALRAWMIIAEHVHLL